MGIDSPIVDEYGWRDTGAACAHAYLYPAVAAALRRRGARRVLDLGCGNGSLTRALAAAGFDAMGCDADREGIEIASREGGRFTVASVYDDPRDLGATGFDAVVSAEVVEHLFSPRRLPRYAAALLRPGGVLIVTTPYHGYAKNLAIALLGRWDRHADPLWEGGHIKLFSRATLTRLLETEGFGVEEFHGLGRVPWLWKSMMVVARAPGSGPDVNTP